MKEVWVKADPWNKDLVTAALEAGADAVVVPEDKVLSVKELGIIKTVSTNGDLKWEEDVVCVEIRSAEDEERIVKLSRDKKVVVRTTDWTIIPLENLAARAENIFVEVKNREEADIAAGILEKGVDGIIITAKNPALIKEIIGSVRSGRKPMDLAPFTIESVTPAGMGDRVCVDTCTMMKPGEGALVGNSSQALFLIHSESIENPYVSPRPFRINAGPVHAYIMGGGGRTRYLSELTSGDEIVGVDYEGRSKRARNHDRPECRDHTFRWKWRRCRLRGPVETGRSGPGVCGRDGKAFRAQNKGNDYGEVALFKATQPV